MPSGSGSGAYPKTAKAYLDDWSTTEAGWLRMYYPSGSDEPHLDATPAVESTFTCFPDDLDAVADRHDEAVCSQLASISRLETVEGHLRSTRDALLTCGNTGRGDRI